MVTKVFIFVNYKLSNLIYTFLSRNLKKKIYIIIVFLTTNLFVRGQIIFAPIQIYPVYSWAEQTFIRDFNNDGLNEILLVTERHSGYENDGKLMFIKYSEDDEIVITASYPYPISYGLDQPAIDIADLNNDGLIDIAVGCDDSIWVYYQDTSGLYNPSTKIHCHEGNLRITDICTGDINGDNLIDITVVMQELDKVIVYYQQQDGTLLRSTKSLPSSEYYYINVGDVNNDSLEDIVLAFEEGIYILHQNTADSLDNAVLYSDTICAVGDVAIGDLNNDGLNDVIKSQRDFLDSRFRIYYQNATTNQLQEPIIIDCYKDPRSVRIGDLNCDGINEIIILHDEGSISIFERNQNGNFSLYTRFGTTYATHYQNNSLDIGDINNDNRIDIINASYVNDKGLTMFLNKTIPTPPVIIGSSLICHNNDTVNYTATTIDINSDISWFIDPVDAGEIIYTENNNCQVAWNNNYIDDAELYATVTNNCGFSNSTLLDITLSKLPELNIGNDQNMCEKDTITIHTNNDEFTSFKWQDNTTDSIYTVTEGGKYYVEASHICGIATDTINITEIPLPEINFPDDTILCIGSQIDLDITLEGNNQYTWQDGSHNPKYIIEEQGVYTARIESYTSCSDEKSIFVSALTPPTLNLPADTTICNDEYNVILDAYCEDCFYTWHDNDTLSEYLVTTEGTYIVTVYNFCDTLTNATNVNIIDCNSYITVPTAFSPNGDGENDILYAAGKNIENINFAIFDRWGKEVFTSRDLLIGWNGEYGGKKLESGVFMYYISAIRTSDGTIIEDKGNITLVR